ncbi:hypothetical protein D3C77_496120 [compost metagenome]
MAQVLARPARGQAAPELPAEPALEGVEHRPVAFTQAVPGACQCLLKEGRILAWTAAGIQIRAVHRVMFDQCLQCPANGAQGQVTAHQVIAGHLQQGLSD